MRATKAYMASLGTTGLLLACSLLLLAVVSALVAFDGWPSAGGDAQADTVLVEAGEDASDTAPEPVEIAAGVTGPASEGPSGSGGDSSPGSPGGGSAPPAGGPGTGGGATGPGDGPSGGSPPGGGTPQAPDPGLADPPRLPGTDGGSTTDRLADAGDETTKTVGHGIAPVSEPVGQGVVDTGQAVSEIVRGLDGP